MDKSHFYQALIVDDEPAVRQLTVRALAPEGFQCHTASDGKEAKQLLKDATYDVVVTDLKMPNCNGHTLVTDLLQHSNRPVIVVLTGVLEPSLVKDLIIRGVEQIEFKPIDCLLFGAKVRALVSRYRLHLSNRPEEDRAFEQGQGAIDSLREMGPRVVDLMSRDVYTTAPTSTMRDVAKQMSFTGVRHLPVVNYKHEPVGMITQRDLFRHMGQALDTDEGVSRALAREFMSTELVSVCPVTPLKEAAEMMLSKKFGCLPVVGEGRQLVGILTRSDLLRHLISLHQPGLECSPSVSTQWNQF